MGKPSLLITPTAVESIECRIMRTDDAREIAVAPHPPIDAESPFSGRREDGLQVEVFVNVVTPRRRSKWRPARSRSARGWQRSPTDRASAAPSARDVGPHEAGWRWQLACYHDSTRAMNHHQGSTAPARARCD
jgi:hypothetical protein